MRSEMGVNKGSDKAKVEPSMKGKGERKSHRHQSPSPSLAVTGNDKNQDIFHCVQGWAKRWDLGCVNSPPAARWSQEAGFTQPRDHSFAQPCSVFLPTKVVNEHDTGIGKKWHSNLNSLGWSQRIRHSHFNTLYYSLQSLAPSLEKNRLSTKLFSVAPPQIGKNPLLDIRGEEWGERVSFIQS